MKISIWNVAHVITLGTTTAMQISVHIASVGFLPKWVQYNTIVTSLTVLYCPFSFLNSAHRSNRWTNFHALWRKQRVSSELEWWVTSFGTFQKALKVGVNRHFQAKTQKIKIAPSLTTIAIKPKLEDHALAHTDHNYTSCVVHQLHFVRGPSLP